MINQQITTDAKAADIIEHFQLLPHPEGGHYKEIFRDKNKYDDRSVCTSIYFLLQKGERSHWHKVDAAEIWHWYAGAPLSLQIFDEQIKKLQQKTLSFQFTSGHEPQVIVPGNFWQSAETLGDWTFVGCTVAPAFEFSKFELAPPDWKPAM